MAWSSKELLAVRRCHAILPAYRLLQNGSGLEWHCRCPTIGDSAHQMQLRLPIHWGSVSSLHCYNVKLVRYTMIATQSLSCEQHTVETRHAMASHKAHTNCSSSCLACLSFCRCHGLCRLWRCLCYFLCVTHMHTHTHTHAHAHI